MPPIMQYFEAQRRRGGKLIVVDPRHTPTAKAATCTCKLTPGTDAALANGLLHVAIRDRLIDDEFIAARTTGFEEVRRVVASYWPDRVERHHRRSRRAVGARRACMLGRPRRRWC